MKLGDYQRAADSFAYAIEHDNSHVAAHRHMADALTGLGHPELADEYHRKADAAEAANSSMPADTPAHGDEAAPTDAPLM
jgi:Tfp pilus assembly protein PilF